MAAVEVTISGVLYDKLGRTIQQVVLIGEASLTGLGVGGGPMPPGQGGGSPPGIWGPTDPRPTPPIQLPPGYPGSPPGIWGGGNVPMPTPPIANVPGAPGYTPPGGGGGGGPVDPGYFPPRPAHPIVLPPDPPPTEPPTEPPADANWVWGWNRSNGWHPVYVPAEGDPAPHTPPAA